MGKCKDPNWMTGRKGKNWTVSLRRAAEAGAVIVVEETGEQVLYKRPPGKGQCFRPWQDDKGHRYDSFECIPVF
jgi:predicted ATPase